MSLFTRWTEAATGVQPLRGFVLWVDSEFDVPATENVAREGEDRCQRAGTDPAMLMTLIYRFGEGAASSAAAVPHQ